MTPLAGKHKRFLADFVPIVVALVVVLAFFLVVVPNSGPYWLKYLIAAAVFFVITRVPEYLYFKNKLTPPIAEYRRKRREGRTFSRAELTRYYEAFAAHVPQSQHLAIWLWMVAIVGLSFTSYFWIQHSWVAVIGVVFCGLIAMAIHMSFSYFLVKRLIRPLIEEVADRLEVLPDVSRYRLALSYKIAFSVMGFATLALAAFGVVIYMRLSLALSDITLVSAVPHGQAVCAELKQLPEPRWAEILAGQKDQLWTMVVTDKRGEPVPGLSSQAFDASALPESLDPAKPPTEGQVQTTLRGSVRLFPISGDRVLILMANSDVVNAIMWRTSLVGLVFLLVTLVIFGSYVFWLGRDIGRTLYRTAQANERLAKGDLTKLPSVWSDDELGSMADDLRKSFQGLVRMTRAVVDASGVVEAEVARTVSVTEDIHKQVSSQADSAEKTTGSVKVMEERLMAIFISMEQVARSTQDVSSAILQMQASVEEIARNAEVLTQSVEKTASSSTQISASAVEVKSSTDRLHVSAQEAVSFLTQQDAALDETRRSAGALSEASTRVTQDAEAGFSSVAAVEEEILRTKSASEKSRAALSDLSASIEKIGRIVDVIQDVTEQTNLLSLNASIIAAGAGEHGKPFAVVATQIRELSARTAGNAKEIRSVIRSLTNSGEEMATSMDHTFQVVERSTDLSRAAGDALRTILESASTQEEMCKRIAAATDELAHGGQSANRAMHQIFEMVEGIAKAVQEQAASTRFLNEEAERVREVARQLKNATDEQARGARVIGDAVRRIMDDSRQTTQAAQTQTQEAKAISDSMQQVSETAQSIEEAFTELMAAANRLSSSAESLREGIRAFKT